MAFCNILVGKLDSAFIRHKRYVFTWAASRAADSYDGRFSHFIL